MTTDKKRRGKKVLQGSSAIPKVYSGFSTRLEEERVQKNSRHLFIYLPVFLKPKMKYILGPVFPFHAFLPYQWRILSFFRATLCIKQKLFVAIPTTAVEAEEGSGKKKVFFLFSLGNCMEKNGEKRNLYCQLRT